MSDITITAPPAELGAIVPAAEQLHMVGATVVPEADLRLLETAYQQQWQEYRSTPGATLRAVNAIYEAQSIIRGYRYSPPANGIGSAMHYATDADRRWLATLLAQLRNPAAIEVVNKDGSVSIYPAGVSERSSYNAGQDDGYADGYETGYSDGYSEGYHAGFRNGKGLPLVNVLPPDHSPDGCTCAEGVCPATDADAPARSAGIEGGG